MATSVLPSATRNKFTGKEYDDEFGINYFYFGARYYDAQIGRFMTRDRFAEKYPSLTPYHYAANNPVLFIDVNGDSIDYSKLTEEQRKQFQKLIEQLSTDKKFAKVWGTLVGSKAIYQIVVNEAQRQAGKYTRNSDEPGSGGMLSLKSFDRDGVEETFAHESYHGYSHDQGFPGTGTYGGEVEASLFGTAVAFNLSLPTRMFKPGGIPIFETSFQNLLFGESFNENDWIMATVTFKRSGLMDPDYRFLRSNLYTPQIRRFYPLVKR
jgi:RHS repeat-associated protein